MLTKVTQAHHQSITKTTYPRTHSPPSQHHKYTVQSEINSWKENSLYEISCPPDNFKKYEIKHIPKNNVILKTQDMSQLWDETSQFQPKFRLVIDSYLELSKHILRNMFYLIHEVFSAHFSMQFKQVVEIISRATLITQESCGVTRRATCKGLVLLTKA